mgnify:CR=1 FL=1|tara:strand:+ start:130 stop:729 length:600 start_codon:yes stop_codon:yes gene_type:complete
MFDFKEYWNNLVGPEYTSQKKNYFIFTIVLLAITGFSFAGLGHLWAHFTWLAVAFILVIHIIAYVYSLLLQFVVNNGKISPLGGERELPNKWKGIIGLFTKGEELDKRHLSAHYSGIYGVLLFNFFIASISALNNFKDVHIPRDDLTDEEYDKKVKQVNSLKGWLTFLTVLILLTSIPHLINWGKNIWKFASKPGFIFA